MTNIYQDDGKRIAVTNCRFSPLVVTQIRPLNKVQVSFGPKNKLKEFFLLPDQQLTAGQSIDFDSVFSVGDVISVTGTSKGHGFAGVIKRYGFHRQPVSGGQSDRVRAPGSIGAQTPGKVVKGKKMPGHYGHVTKTILGLKIISIDKENRTFSVSGSIPGNRNSWVVINKK